MPGTSTSDDADVLRSKARNHPTVTALEDQLPELDDDPEPGLYIDTRAAPGLTVNGELRVSVARVHSADEDGETLVGQVQAVREVDHPLEEWRLKLYWHRPEHFCTEHVEDADAWFLQVLDSHYAATDAEPEPEIELAVEA
jgi:hypothetical protein